MSRIKPQICLKYGNEFFSFRQKYANDIECPECRQTTKFPKGTLKNLPINRLIGTLFEENGLKLNMIPKKELDALLKKVKK